MIAFKLPLGPARFWAVVLCASCTGATLPAQTALFVEHQGGMARVRQVKDDIPFVDDGKGGVVHATGKRLALQPAIEYVPYTVSLSHVDGHGNSGDMGGGPSTNNTFHFSAEIESPYALKHVYLVLDMALENDGRTYLISEVGDLEPYHKKGLRLHLRSRGDIGSGSYTAHVFSNGDEVFNSTLPPAVIAHALDDMVKSRLAGVADAKPKPLVGPLPEITAGIRDKTGQAVIRCAINPQGRVVDATVKSASAPELGEAALAAARQWRFLPKVVGGTPVASTISIPFAFPPN